MCARTLLLVVLVCARAASAAASNGSVDPRSFGYGPPQRNEPLDLTRVDGDDIMGQNGSSPVGANMTEAALLFLTGAVSTVLIPSFYALVCLVSVPVNVLAVLAFARRIRPKKPAAIYMLNLALADLLFAATLPFKVAYHFSGNDWVFGPLMCRAVTAAFYWNMYCSVLLVACISVDRLLAVVYPIDSLVWRRPRNAVVACVAMWVLSFAGSLPLVVSEQTLRVTELDITTCHDVLPTHDLIWRHRIYFVTLCCALFFLPLLVTVASYARVIWSLSRVAKGVPGRSRRRTRAVVMALTVLVMFLLCFTPTNVLLMVHYLQLDEGAARSGADGSYAVYLVLMCVGSLSCLLDPLVYYFGSSQCQRELSSALRCQKIPRSSSESRSSRSSSRTILKYSRAESSRTNPPAPQTDSFQADQYKKLLV